MAQYHFVRIYIYEKLAFLLKITIIVSCFMIYLTGFGTREFHSTIFYPISGCLMAYF
jgi:hypothetical protein